MVAKYLCKVYYSCLPMGSACIQYNTIFGATPVYLLIKVDSEPLCFLWVVVSKLKKTVLEPTETGVWGQRSTSYTTSDCIARA